MIKYFFITLSVSLIFILAFSCDKEKDKTGQLTIGVNWVNLNCGPGTAKVYIDNNLVGTITDISDTVTLCNQINCLTITEKVGNHSYKVSFKDDCSIKSGQINIVADECNKLFVKF